MASIGTEIELNDNFTGDLNNIVNAVNMSVSAMEQMQSVMSGSVDTAALDGIRNYADQAAVAIREMSAAAENAAPPAPVEVPFTWESADLDIFTGSGAERFNQEAESTNALMERLSALQSEITQRAVYGNVIPPQALNDMIALNERIQALQQRIQQISANHINMSSQAASSELEQLRAQLNQAVDEQVALNRAVGDMDVGAANTHYLRLSNIVGATERDIRDNTDEQGRFNSAIQQGASTAGGLKSVIAKAANAFSIEAAIQKMSDFVLDCTDAFNTQLNSEMQLAATLANVIGGTELEADVSLSAEADTNSVTAAYDRLTSKAAEIQSNGMYGDETMIAAAAELSTYFTDTGAVEMMMDTLADYAAGMSGGGEIDASGMVNYASNLGNLMSGSYDTMTEKGFEFSDAQKAIIEGTASQEQIAAVLGEEYVGMTSDMQAAAAISQVIEESWGGLYQSMSSTPQGKIIQLKNAWGSVKEVVGGQLYPAIIGIVDIINENWSTVQAIIEGVTEGLSVVLNVLGMVAEAVFAAAEFFVNNWSWIAPVIAGIATALAVYYGWVLLVKAVTAIAAVAQGLWNAAMNMSPAGAAALTVGALVAALGLYTNHVNVAYGLSLSFAGMLGGVLMTVLAALGNMIYMIWDIVATVVVFVWNIIADLVNFLGNVFTDPLGAIARLFFDVFDSILGIIEGVAGAIGNLFGQDWSSGIAGFREEVNKFKEENFGTGVEVVKKLDPNDLSFENTFGIGYTDYDEAFEAGYWLGEDLAGNLNTTNEDDYSALDTINGQLEGIEDDGEGTNENTGNIADSLEITAEDLKYLRDIAEQETVNRFTTAEITIEQTNHNNVSGKLDLDGVVNGLTEAVNEAAYIIAEGVHA